MHRAALDVKEQARRVAANLLEASEADLELDAETGNWQVRGDPATGQTWADVAGHAGPDGLAAAVEYTGGRPTFPFGTHLAVAEVDTQTGKARLVRLVTVGDAGTVVNPVLAEGSGTAESPRGWLRRCWRWCTTRTATRSPALSRTTP